MIQALMLKPFKWLKNLVFGKDFSEVVSETKSVKINGIRFKIKKVNLLNYLDGSKLMLQHYDIHENQKKNESINKPDIAEKEIIKHYSQVLVAGVVEPKLSFSKDEPGKVWVEEIFMDWEVANGLYSQIMEYTYGKKKLKQLISLSQDLSKLTA